MMSVTVVVEDRSKEGTKCTLDSNVNLSLGLVSAALAWTMSFANILTSRERESDPAGSMLMPRGSLRSIDHMSCIFVNSLGGTFLDTLVRVFFVRNSRTLGLCR